MKPIYKLNISDFEHCFVSPSDFKPVYDVFDTYHDLDIRRAYNDEFDDFEMEMLEKRILEKYISGSQNSSGLSLIYDSDEYVSKADSGKLFDNSTHYLLVDLVGNVQDLSPAVERVFREGEGYFYSVLRQK